MPIDWKEWGEEMGWAMAQWIKRSPSMFETLGSKLSTSKSSHGDTGLGSKREFNIAWLCSGMEARQGYLSPSLRKKEKEKQGEQCMKPRVLGSLAP